jgi:hypothetical protein
MTKFRNPALLLLLGLLLAIILHHTLMMVYGEKIRGSIMTSLELLDGRPHWRVFQNRVLGPLIARTLMRTVREPDIGYILFHLICFGTGLILAWRTGLRVAASHAGALVTMLTFALGLASLFMGEWFYPWDVSGAAIFMGFAWLVASGASYVWIAALFAVAIWNRDDALFIALFLIVEPVARWWRNRNGPAAMPIDWRPIALGFACIVAGVVLIEMLRRLLLVEELGLKLWGPPPDTNQFFRWTLVYNIKYVLRDMSFTSLDMPVFVLLPPVAAIGSCCYLAFASGGRYLGCALVNLALSAATLMFGLIHEIRIWVDMVPVVVLAAAVALAPSDAPATEARTRL